MTDKQIRRAKQSWVGSYGAPPAGRRGWRWAKVKKVGDTYEVWARNGKVCFGRVTVKRGFMSDFEAKLFTHLILYENNLRIIPEYRNLISLESEV